MPRRRSSVPYAVLAVLLSLAAPAVAAETTVVLILPDGTPAAGAQVDLLRSYNVHLATGPETVVLESIRADENGQVRIAGPNDRFCFLAYSEDAAAFACHTAHVAPGEALVVEMEPAVRIRGRLEAPEGTDLSRASVRAIVAGGFEMHGIDATVRPDGTFELPPLPPSLLGRGQPVLEARAPGLAPASVAIDPRSGSVTIPIAPERKIRGRLVDAAGEPVGNARVTWVPENPASSDQLLLPEEGTRSGSDGTFVLGVPPNRDLLVYALPETHAAASVPLAAGAAPVDLDDIELAEGEPIRGRVRERDDREITQGFASLTDSRGVRVREADIRAGGDFVLPHVGPGLHDLVVFVHRSEGIAGSRQVSATVEAGGDPLEFVVPRGVVMRLRDEEGEPVVTTTAELRLEYPDAPWNQEEWSPEGFSEIRLQLWGPARIHAEIRVPGYEPSGFLLDVSAWGTGRGTFVLKPDGSPTCPPGARFPGHPAPPEEPMTEELRAIEPPDLGDRADVVRYVDEILATTADRSRWSSTDPEVRMYAAVGPDHVDVLLDAMKRRSRDFHLLTALDRLLAEPHRKLVLARLPGIKSLARFLVPRGWAADARSILVGGLMKELDGDPRIPMEFPVFLPTEWIEALASLRAPETYPLLLEYLARGGNSHMTYEAIRDLPGIEIEEAVAKGWERAKESPFGGEYMMTVAVRFGHRDALERLVETLSLPEGDHRRPYNALRLLKQITDYRGTGTEEDVTRWFGANLEKLVFDDAQRRWVIE